MPKKAGYSANFLVVEDEEGARNALSKILQTYGHNVIAVEDGEAALDAFGSGEGIDIVLTDLTLPGISGWDVAKSIKETSPNTPVLVLSGWDIKKDDENIAACGVSQVLAKPIKVRDMLDVVDKFLVKRK